MSYDVDAVHHKLSNFYREEIAALRLSKRLPQQKIELLSAPFLLNVHATRAYFDAQTRIMFVGQETKGWLCRLPDVFNDPEYCIPRLLTRYEKGLLDEAGRSHFLKMLRLLETEITGSVPGSIIWNNLFKMDVYRGKGKTRNARNYSAALTEFSAKIFRYECELLRPDVIVFGCSATHDAVIKSLFEAPKRKTVCVHVPKELWHFTYDQINCFRTLHPAVARFGKHQTVRKHYQTIIKEINSRNIRAEFKAEASEGLAS